MNQTKSWPEKLPRVTAVKALEDFSVELKFNDGSVGIVDMKGWVVGRGGIFETLSNPTVFAQVRLSDSGGTIEWPGGIDLCPDVLYSRVTGIPIPFAEPEPAPATKR
jgi:hypothetical protein